MSQFNIEITVTEPRKMGDGMNAYMAYRVNTKVRETSCRSHVVTMSRKYLTTPVSMQLMSEV